MTSAPRGSRLLSDMVSFAFGNLSAQFVTIAMIPFYTQQLSTSEYGSLDLILAAAALVLPAATLSVSDAVLRFLVHDPERRGPILAGGLLVTLVGATVCLVASVVMGVVTDQRLFLFSLPALVAAQGYQNLMAQYTRALGGSRLFALSGVTQALTLAVCNVLLLGFLDMGVEGYLVSVLVSNATAIVFLSTTTHRTYGHAALSIQWPLIRTMLAYSTPLVPNSAIWWVVNMSSRFFLLASAGLGTVGVYAIAVRVPTLITVVSLVFAQAWQLTAFREHSSQDQPRFYARVFEIYSSSLCLGIAVILVVLKPLFAAAVSPEYYIAWTFTPYLLLAALFMAFSSFIGTNYLASMGTKHAFSTSLLGGLACVSLSALLVPPWGGIGAAVATMGGYAVMWLARVWNTWQLVTMQPRYTTLVVNLGLIASQVVALNIGIQPSWETGVLASIVCVMVVVNKRELTDGWRQASVTVRHMRS